MTPVQLPAPAHVFSDEDLRQKLARKGANFTVDTIPTPNPFGGPESFLTSFRTDSKMLFQQGLKKGWTPIQNIEMLRCLAELSKYTDVELADIRVMRGGAKICVQVSLGKFDVGGGDMVEKFLCAMVGHDGSVALSVYITPYRWWCDNQITPSLYLAKAENRKGKKALVSIKHTTSSKDKLKKLVETVHIAHDQFIQTEQVYAKLRDTAVTDEWVKDVLNRYFPKPQPKEGERLISKRKLTNYKLRIQDVSRRFYSADGGRTPRDTAWNLYNAIQGHLQHYRNPNDSDARWESAITGQISNTAAALIPGIFESVEHVPQNIRDEINEMVEAI